MLYCSKCKKEFYIDDPKDKEYRKHIRKCNGDKHFCKICGKEFKNANSIGGHTSCVHGSNKMNEKINFKCDICGITMFCNKGTYNAHLNSHNEKWKEKRAKSISDGKKEFYNDIERSKNAREFMSNFMKNNNPMKNKENIDKMVKSRKKYFENLTDEEYSKMVINFINAPKKSKNMIEEDIYKPSYIEQMIIDLKIPDLIYNGNKKDSKTIRFKNTNYKKTSTPDFLVKNTNKIIEVFGVYWHPIEHEEIYKKAYEENGYEVLILWEDELNLNFEECKNKIKNFLEK